MKLSAYARQVGITYKTVHRMTSMAARLYGRRHARTHSERIKHCIQEAYGDHPRLQDGVEGE